MKTRFFLNNNSLGKIVHYWNLENFSSGKWVDQISGATISTNAQTGWKGLDLSYQQVELPVDLENYTIFIIYNHPTQDKPLIQSTNLNLQTNVAGLDVATLNGTTLTFGSGYTNNRLIGISSSGTVFRETKIQQHQKLDKLTKPKVGFAGIQEIIVFDNSSNPCTTINYRNILFNYFVQNYPHSNVNSKAQWNPMVLSPDAWFRGDLGIVLSSGKVSQWTDQSGYNRHLVQATTANQPPAVVNAVGNMPAVQFAALSQMRCSSLNGLSFLGNYSSYLVVKNSNCGDSIYHLAAYAAGSNNQFSVYTNDLTNQTRICAGAVAGSGEVIFPTGSNTTPTLYAVKAGAGAGGSVCRMNNSTGTSTRNGAGTTTSFSCGAYDTAGTQQWNGYLAEWVIFQRVITTVEEAVLLQYFSNRYSTSWV